MTGQGANVKQKLLADIEREWGSLNASLDPLSDVQITQIKDPQGWSVKDHLIHMAYWERGVCFYLQGLPRYTGMEIDEDLFEHGDIDEINAVIQQAQKDMSLPEVQALRHYCHRQLLYGVQGMNEADLLKPYQKQADEENGGQDTRLVLEMIYDNTAGHFAEHCEWIHTLVESQP